MSEYLFKNKWTLWFHSITNKNWDNKSYIKVLELKTLFDYKLLKEVINVLNELKKINLNHMDIKP